MIIVLLEPAFLFFVLTSGRPLPVTTFFVFSKPLCSHFAVQIVIREFSASLQKRCLSLSKGFPLQPKFATAAAQRFYSTFVALLEAILQRCSGAARFVQESINVKAVLGGVCRAWCGDLTFFQNLLSNSLPTAKINHSSQMHKNFLALISFTGVAMVREESGKNENFSRSGKSQGIF